MFDSIEVIEKQVKEFQENMLASEKLLLDIESLTNTVKEQENNCEERYQEALSTMKSCVAKVKDETDHLIEMENNNASNLQKLINETVEKIKKNDENTGENVICELKNIIDLYNNNLNENRKHIDEMIEKLSLKYRQFVEEIESTNLSNLFSEMQLMRKSLENKIIIAISASGVALIAVVVSIFIK